MDFVKFCNMIGGLQFSAPRSGPDIILAVKILAQYSAVPTQFLMKSVTLASGYLKLAQDLSLQFEHNSQSDEIITLYIDSDFGGDQTTRASLNQAG